MTYLEEVNGRSITVRNIEYTIEVLSEEEMNEREGETTLGVCSPSKGLITIRDGLNDDRAEQTLIHELTHAMFFESGYTFDSDDQHEAINEALSLVVQDMVNSGALRFEFDDEDVEFVVGEPKKADPNDPRFQHLGSPIFEGKPLFDMFLVKTLWDTYTVNTYGKNRLDLAIQKNVTNVEVYDFQTKKHQYIALSHITEVTPLENKKEEPKECIEYYFVSTKHRDYKVSQFAYERIVEYMDNTLVDSVNAFDYITEQYINIRPNEVTEVHKLIPVPFKEEK